MLVMRKVVYTMKNPLILTYDRLIRIRVGLWLHGLMRAAAMEQDFLW
jgi:hypothetical protein